ncbi:MAG TPA: glucose 1-dehydrogenase [Rhizomicrobium sp.]|jgi:NAD(P)-dependent dehydrogenase (short-subunit alcohol dehydrogenase family)|nr:glucose 1-dehydrogenase [Rhizomicrobium sp.]
MGRVQGKVALVTGGSSGIGRGSAQLLGQEGATVVVTDIIDDAGKDTVAAIKRAGGDAIYLHHDVTSEDQWIKVIGEIKSRFGKLDILVNNAGIAITGPIIDMTLENWRKQQAINLDGVFLGTKHGIPLMAAGGGGSIINISSVAGLKGSANLAGYCATKGGVRLFTKATAMECTNAGYNIRVNSIHPGLIETPIWNAIIVPGSPAGANAPNLDELSKGAVPMGVKGVPHDIAEGVLFLASDASRYMTGTELVIDGGLMTK